MDPGEVKQQSKSVVTWQLVFLSGIKQEEGIEYIFHLMRRIIIQLLWMTGTLECGVSEGKDLPQPGPASHRERTLLLIIYENKPHVLLGGHCAQFWQTR